MANITTGMKWKTNTPMSGAMGTCSCVQNNITTFNEVCGCGCVGICSPATPAEPHHASPPVCGRNWKETHGLPFSEDERLREDPCKKPCCTSVLKTGTCGTREPSRRAPSRIVRNPCSRRVTPDTCTGPGCHARLALLEEPETCGYPCTAGTTTDYRPSTCPARQPRSPVRRCPVFRRPIPVKCLEASEPERPWTGARPPKPVPKDPSCVKRPIKTCARPSVVGSVTGRHPSPSKSKRTSIPVRSSVGDQKPTSPLLCPKLSQRPKPDVGDGLGRSRLSQSPVRKRQPLKPVPKPAVSQRTRPSEMKRRMTPVTKDVKRGSSPKGKRDSKAVGPILTTSVLNNVEGSDTNEEELLMEVLLEPKPDDLQEESPEQPTQKKGGIPTKTKCDDTDNPLAVDECGSPTKCEDMDNPLDDCRNVGDPEKEKVKHGDPKKEGGAPFKLQDVGCVFPLCRESDDDVEDCRKEKMNEVEGENECNLPNKIPDVCYDVDRPLCEKDGIDCKLQEAENECIVFSEKTEDDEKQFSKGVVPDTPLENVDKDICCVGGKPGEEPLELCVSLLPLEDPRLHLVAVDSCDDTCVSEDPHHRTSVALNAQKSRQPSKSPIRVDICEHTCEPIAAEELIGKVCENAIIPEVSCGDGTAAFTLLEPCAEVCESSSGEPCETHFPPPDDFACTPVPECTVATCTSVEPTFFSLEASCTTLEKNSEKREHFPKTGTLPSQTRKESEELRSSKGSPERIKTLSVGDSSKVKSTEISDAVRRSSITTRTDSKMASSKPLSKGDTVEQTMLKRIVSPSGRSESPKSAESPTRSGSSGRPQSPEKFQAVTSESPRSSIARKSGSPKKYESMGSSERESRKSAERPASPDGFKSPDKVKSPERFESPKRIESMRRDSSKRSQSPRKSEAPKTSASPLRTGVPRRSETSKDEKEQRVYEPETLHLPPVETGNYCTKCESVEREIKTENLEMYSLQTEEVEEFVAEVAMGGDSLIPQKSKARSFPHVSSKYSAQVSTPDLELLWKAPSEYLDVSVNVSVSGHVVGKEGIETVPELSTDSEAMDVVREGAIEPILRSLGETATPSENMRVTDESLRRIMGSPTSIAMTIKESYKTAQGDVARPAASIKGIFAEKVRVSHKKLSFAPLPTKSPLTNDTTEEAGDVKGYMMMEAVEHTQLQPTKKESVQYDRKTPIVRTERHSRPCSGNRESPGTETLASADAATDTKLTVKSNVRISDDIVCHEIKINFKTPSDFSCASPCSSKATSPPRVIDSIPGDGDTCPRKKVFLQHRTPQYTQESVVRHSEVPKSSSPVSLVREGKVILTSLPEISYVTVDEKHESHVSAIDLDADKLSGEYVGERFAGPPLPEGVIQSPCYSPERSSSEEVDDCARINICSKVPPDTRDSIEGVGEELPPDTPTDFIKDILNFDITTRATAKEEELTSQSLAHIAEVEVSRDSLAPSSDTSVGKVTVVEIEEASNPENTAHEETLTSAGDDSVSSVEFDPAFLQRVERTVESLPHSVEGYRKSHVSGDGREAFETVSSIPPDVVPPIKEMRRTEIPVEVRDVLRKLTSMHSDVDPAIRAVREKSIPVEVKDILQRLSTLEKNVDEFLGKGMNGISEEGTCSEVDSVLPEKLTPEMKYPDTTSIPGDVGDVSDMKPTKLPPSDNTEYPPCLCFPDEERRRDRKRKRPCVCPPSYQKREDVSPEEVEAETDSNKSEILFELRVFNPPKEFEDVKEEAKPIASTTVKRRGLVATKITKNGGDDRKGTKKGVCICARDSTDTKSGGAKAQTLVSKSTRISVKKEVVTPQEPGDAKTKRKETPSRPPGAPKMKASSRKNRPICICKGESPSNASVIPSIYEGKPCPDVERTTLFMIRRRELIPIASLPPEIDFPQKIVLDEKVADSETSTESQDEIDNISQEGSRNVDNEFYVSEILKATESHKVKATPAARSGDRAAAILARVAKEGENVEESVSKGSEELPWEDALDTFSANLESITNDKLREEIRKFVTSRFEDVNACRHLPEEITLGIHYYADDSEDAVKKSTRESASQVLSQIMEVEREVESDSQVPSEGEESDVSKLTYAVRESEQSDSVERTCEDSTDSNMSNDVKNVPVQEAKKPQHRPEVKSTFISHKIVRNRSKDSQPRDGNDVVGPIEPRRAVDRSPGVKAGDKIKTPTRSKTPTRTAEKETIPPCVKAARVSEARLRSPSPRNSLRRPPPKKVDSQVKSTYSTECRTVHESRHKGNVSHLSPSRGPSKLMHKQSSGDSKRKEKMIPDPHEKLSLSFSAEDVKKRMSLRGDTKLKESPQKNSFLSDDCVWEDAVESLSKSEMASKTSKDAEVFVPLRPIVVSNDIVEFVTRFTRDQVRQGLSISKIFSRLKDKMEQRKTADVAVVASRQSLVTRTLSDAQTQTEPVVSKTVKILVEKSSEVSVRVREVSVDKLGRRKQSKELTASVARGREISYSASNARVTHVEERRVSSQKLIVGEHGVSSRNSTREDVVIRMVPARGAQKDMIEIWRDDRMSDPVGMEVEVSHVSYDPHVIRGGVPEEEKEQQIAWEPPLEAGEAGFDIGSTIQQQTICEEQRISLNRSVNDSFSQTPIGDGPFLESGDGLSPRTTLNVTALEKQKSTEKTDKSEKVELPTVEATLEMGDNQCIELEQSNIQQQTICLQQQKIQITSSVIQQQKIHTSRSPLRSKKKDSGEYHPGSLKSFKDHVSTAKLINLPPDICGCPLPTDANKPVFDDLPIVILHENTGSARLPFNRSVPEDMAFQADESLKHVHATTALRKSSNTLHDHIKQKRKFSSWDAMLEEAERRLSETEEKRRAGAISHEQAAKEFSNVARALRRSARKGIRNREDLSKKDLGEEEEGKSLRRV